MAQCQGHGLWAVERSQGDDNWKLSSSWLMKRHRKDICIHFCLLLCQWQQSRNSEKEAIYCFGEGSSGYWTRSLEAGRRDVRSPPLSPLSVWVRAIHLSVPVSSAAKRAFLFWPNGAAGRVNGIIWRKGSKQRSWYSLVPDSEITSWVSAQTSPRYCESHLCSF